MVEKRVCKSTLKGKVLESVKRRIPKKNIVRRTTESFKVLSDSTRFKILFCLSQNELSVCDISSILSMTHSATSHQLRILRHNNLVEFRKEGIFVFYSLADKHIIELIKMGVEHAKE